MAQFTEKDVERLIARVFPAAEIMVSEHYRPPTSSSCSDTDAGEWVDALESELLDEEEPTLGYTIVTYLNVIEGIDTLGRRAFVPHDYADRYGWPKWPESELFDPYEDPPIDSVPPDDVINPQWAIDKITASFPEASIEVTDEGQMILDPQLYWLPARTGGLLFTNDVGEAVDDDLRDTISGPTVWDREQEREDRLRRSAAQATRGIDRSLTFADRIKQALALLELSGTLEDEIDEALRYASIRLASPSDQPIEEVVQGKESATVEYKATAQANLRTHKKSSSANEEVVTTVAAFLNSVGGVLVIGIHDNGHQVGLEPDLARVGGSQDTLKRNVVASLGRALTDSTVSLNVTVEIEKSGTDLLVIRVSPSPSPVYAVINNQEHFCVRSGSSTLRLTHSEADSYKNENWGRGTSEVS
jgi:hypothetical protein